MAQYSVVNPLDLVIADFVPQNPTQEEFVTKAGLLVGEYITKIAPLIRECREAVSTVNVSDVVTNSCKRSGFLEWRMGRLVTELPERVCLFFDFKEGAQFQIVDKCPYVGDLDEPNHRYHLRHEGGKGDQGTSDSWKQFPLRAVLAGMRALLEQLENDVPFAEANEQLDAELSALSK